MSNINKHTSTALIATSSKLKAATEGLIYTFGEPVEFVRFISSLVHTLAMMPQIEVPESDEKNESTVYYLQFIQNLVLEYWLQEGKEAATSMADALGTDMLSMAIPEKWYTGVCRAAVALYIDRERFGMHEESFTEGNRKMSSLFDICFALTDAQGK